LSCSKLFLELFGTVKDLNELSVKNVSESHAILHIKFPDITVPTHFKHELDHFVLDETNKNSLIFRRLIGSLIPEHADWAIRNGKQMLLDYNDLIMAAFGK
jgi:hypothetical protein